MKYSVALVCGLLLGIIALPVMAQERGRYIPGFTGLNSGIQAPEGITYVNVFVWYPASKFKDQNVRKN